MSSRIPLVPLLLATLLACSNSPTTTGSHDVQLSVLNALSATDAARASTSEAEPMSLRLSRSHCTAAPAIATEPSRAYIAGPPAN